MLDLQLIMHNEGEVSENEKHIKYGSCFARRNQLNSEMKAENLRQ